MTSLFNSPPQSAGGRPLSQPPVGEYLRSDERSPLFVVGDSVDVLRSVPAGCIDCCLTSPPYWGHRAYAGGGIGEEPTPQEYVSRLLRVLDEVRRVLKSTGSLWLNLGDTYKAKSLVGLPWRVALALTDQQGWVLRNSVVWNKVKGGPDNATDKLCNMHEMILGVMQLPVAAARFVGLSGSA